jgi:hypothetical protein
MAEKRYHVSGSADHWRISENGSEPAGDYATREGALEVVYLAASNDIKSGHGITIKIDPPPEGASAIGAKAQ